MDSAARIGVWSHHLTTVVNPEREGHVGAGDINAGVYAAAEQEPMHVPRAAKITCGSELP